MLLSFFETLRRYQVLVSTREMLDCLNALAHGLVRFDIAQFYMLSRLSLVKDEKLYDRFDRAFASFFSGLDNLEPLALSEEAQTELRTMFKEVGQEKEFENALKDYLAKIESLKKSANDINVGQSEPGMRPNDGDDESTSQKASEPGGADERGEAGEESGESGEEGDDGREGKKGDRGDKGEGDEGFEGDGESEEGVVGTKQELEQAAKQRASQLWALRRFEALDEKRELGTRNLKVALRRVRKLARTGAQFELDLDDTIRRTARNAGLLDIVEVPERHNSVKVLLFLDIGGSMDEHVLLCEQLFAAAKYEFKHLHTFFFHNFLYEKVWTDAERLPQHQIPTADLARRYSADYKVIFVGDADMARHEVTEKGGSVEHYNAVPGETWFNSIQEHFRRVVWLNPSAEKDWWNSDATLLIQRLLEDEMYPLTVAGIDLAARSLTK
jgi:uncharacterized protein with von Willebrand factor type A (vWA) domain